MDKKPRKRNARTESSSFGTSGRISHDSFRYYNSKLYKGLNAGGEIEYIENPIPAKYVNRIFCKSSEKMDRLPDNSVHLMVTSPPYNVGKDYDGDLSLEEYLGLLNGYLLRPSGCLFPAGAHV